MAGAQFNCMCFPYKGKDACRFCFGCGYLPHDPKDPDASRDIDVCPMCHGTTKVDHDR